MGSPSQLLTQTQQAGLAEIVLLANAAEYCFKSTQKEAGLRRKVYMGVFKFKKISDGQNVEC